MIYFWFCLYWIKYFTGSAEACWGRYAQGPWTLAMHFLLIACQWVMKFASAMSHKCYRCFGLQKLFVEKMTSTKWKKNCRIEQLSNSR